MKWLKQQQMSFSKILCSNTIHLSECTGISSLAWFPFEEMVQCPVASRDHSIIYMTSFANLLEFLSGLMLVITHAFT